jgi:hypothetical protein
MWGEGRRRKVAQTMYTHVSKYKGDKIKNKKNMYTDYLVLCVGNVNSANVSRQPEGERRKAKYNMPQINVEGVERYYHKLIQCKRKRLPKNCYILKNCKCTAEP